MKAKKVTAILLSALMALSASAVAAPAAFAADPAQVTTLTAEPSETVTVEWSNPDYPVIKNDAGEYVAIGKAGTPIKYNGLQVQTTTTKNSDGTQTVEKVRYTFKDGKCTDVKTTTNSSGTTATTPNKPIESSKVTYSNDKYALSEDGKQVITADTGKPVKYNGLLIRTTINTYTDGSTSTVNERFNFKDGVLQETK